MAEKRKSLIDEALLESEQIKKAFETNAKEILTRTMGSEIEEMVKESLEEKDSNGLKEDENEEEALELLDLDDASSAGDEDLDIELGDEEMEDMEDMGDMEDMEDMDSDELEIVDLTDEDDDTVVNVFKNDSIRPSKERQDVFDEFLFVVIQGFPVVHVFGQVYFLCGPVRHLCLFIKIPEIWILQRKHGKSI